MASECGGVGVLTLCVCCVRRVCVCVCVCVWLCLHSSWLAVQVPAHLSDLTAVTMGSHGVATTTALDALLSRRPHPIAVRKARALATRLSHHRLTPLLQRLAPRVVAARMVLVHAGRRLLLVPETDASPTFRAFHSHHRNFDGDDDGGGGGGGDARRDGGHGRDTGAAATGGGDGIGATPASGDHGGVSSGWVDLAPCGEGLTSVVWRSQRPLYCPAPSGDARYQPHVDCCDPSQAYVCLALSHLHRANTMWRVRDGDASTICSRGASADGPLVLLPVFGSDVRGGQGSGAGDGTTRGHGSGPDDARTVVAVLQLCFAPTTDGVPPRELPAPVQRCTESCVATLSAALGAACVASQAEIAAAQEAENAQRVGRQLALESQGRGVASKVLVRVVAVCVSYAFVCVSCVFM